jgi:hypothetical protein
MGKWLCWEWEGNARGTKLSQWVSANTLIPKMQINKFSPQTFLSIINIRQISISFDLWEKIKRGKFCPVWWELGIGANGLF